MKNFEKQVVLITGASSGLGALAAQRFAQEGANIVLVARREERLKELASRLQEDYQVQAHVIAADLSQEAAIERVVEKTLTRFGRIDFLLSGAGYGDFKAATEFGYEEVEAMFRLNTLAMIHLINLVAKQMQVQGNGRILIIASIAGKVATPYSSVYSGTKFAMIGYANALRLELSPQGIGVTTINPGPIQTEFFSGNARLTAYFKNVQKWALSPEAVVEAIMKAAARKRAPREVNMPWVLAVSDVLYHLFPRLADRLTASLADQKKVEVEDDSD